MVQYIFTPWRHRRELLAVRRQFYAEASASPSQHRPGSKPQQSSHSHSTKPVDPADAQRAAVARVAVWMQRGHCPHMVESTALLVAALLTDEASGASMGSPEAAYASRAAYAAAFGRFVTGLLDGQQDRARKLSMFSLARTIGLPAAFVELRHEATHEPLPSLDRLRTAARRALAWIWQYYWQRLGEGDSEEQAQDGGGDADGGTADADADPETACRRAVQQLLDSCPSAAEDTQPHKAAAARALQQWGQDRVLATINELSGAPPDGDTDPAFFRRGLKVAALVLALSRPSSAPKEQDPPRWTLDSLDLDAVRATLDQGRQALYRLEGGGQQQQEQKQADAAEEEDVAMADASDVCDPAAPTHESATPNRQPRWTRFEGDWKPRPIGLVI